MDQIRTYATAMLIDAGAVADFDLEVDGFYRPPDRCPSDRATYLIFCARARSLSVRPTIDQSGNAVRVSKLRGDWVELPLTLLTASQIRNLELQAAHAFSEGDDQ